jgi:glycine betaine transporter
MKAISFERFGILFCLFLACIFLLFPKVLTGFFSLWIQKIISAMSLYYLWFGSGVVLLCFALALSPIGRIRLGHPKEKAQFSLFTWITMIFASGIGSGLVFWGMAEPMTHFAHPPSMIDASPTPMDDALAITYFHWGLHAWSIYAIVGLIMAWFCFNQKRSMCIASSFSKTQNGWTQSINLFAVLAVIFGVAGTLANTLILVQTGTETLLGDTLESNEFQVAALLLMALVFTLSSALGIKRGIANLSKVNLVLFLLLLISLIYFTGGTPVFEIFWHSSLSYVKLLPSFSWKIPPPMQQWSQDWSINYFVWWIAWTPFVGAFMAMISRGRTIREFLLIGILVPTLTSMLWFSTFVAGAETFKLVPSILEAMQQHYTQGLFVFFEQLPFGKALTIIALVLLVTFVITSSDSAIYVSSILLRPEHKVDKQNKYIWSFVLVAITLALIYKHDIDLNRQIAILGAIPYSLIMLAQVMSFLWHLLLKRSHFK